MMKRAAVCIGVNHAGSMTPLQAAVQGARDFERWASSQECDTTLLVDGNSTRISVGDIFDVVKALVSSQTYDQLIVYFSGHGILQAPGAEFWLLSRAPVDPNDAVNLVRSVEDARNSGVPHVVFISDACRSSVTGPPLSGVTGGVIFPNRGVQPNRAEVDVYYATRPGDPAYEVSEQDATRRFGGIFTATLLDLLKLPPRELVESVAIGGVQLSVVTSRSLKPHLESAVPIDAATVDVKLRQTPEIRVETALPKYFARVDPPPAFREGGPGPAAPPPTVDDAIFALRSTRIGAQGAFRAETALATELGLKAEVDHLVTLRGRGHFETRTGFSIYGAELVGVHSLRWGWDPPFPEPDFPDAVHLRLHPEGDAERHASSLILDFSGGTGTAVAILPGFIGTIVLKGGRVVSVSYVPSDQTHRYLSYAQQEEQLNQMRAIAAVASRHGRFVVEDEDAVQLAARIRQAKGIDPTMGLYAAYAYNQVGRYKDVESVFRYMVDDEIELPVPFDVVMLAARYDSSVAQASYSRPAPFAPMLAQGWALLMPGDPLHHPIHERLRPHLVPSLWATLDAEGSELAAEAIMTGEVR